MRPGTPPRGVDLERVRARLGRDRPATLDLAAAYGRYLDAGGRDDEDAFVEWLRVNELDEGVALDPTVHDAFVAASAPTVVLGPSAGTPADGAPQPALATAGPGAPSGRPRYSVVGIAGRGGMATVHVARDTALLRKVALKQLSAGAAAAEARARFVREVQISAQLDHPNIVPVYSLEVGPDGAPAYAMKLVRGRTLAQYLDETRAFYERGEAPGEAHALPARLEHFLKVCDAMHYAHRKGVIHRDLKPANIMIGPHHEIYVMDWGICRLLRAPTDPEATMLAAGAEPCGDEADSQTRFGTIVGTPRYMSPEQAQGRVDALSPASDQCSLGLMLYEIVTLGPPFEGRGALEVLNRAARGELRPIEHAYRRERVAPELAAVIRRAAAPDPAARYATVGDLAADLRRYLRGDPVEARPDTPWQAAQRWVGRRRQLVLVTLLAAIALGTGSAAWLVSRQEQALIAAQAREARELQILDVTVGRGHRLQARLLEVQGELETLAAVVAQAVQHGTESRAPWYWGFEFEGPGRQPPDLVVPAGYRTPMSFQFGVWIPTPDRRAAELEPLVRRINRTRPVRQRVFQRAAAVLGRSGTDPAAATSAEGFQHSGLEELRLFVQGVTHVYPGRPGLPRTFDPRGEPWYRLGSGQPSPHWGVPTVGDRAERVTVPISLAIVDDADRELGVASLLVSLEHVLDSLMADTPDARTHTTLLIDRDGRLLGAAGQPPRVLPLLEVFPDPAVLGLVRTRDTGKLVTTAFGGRDLVAFDSLHPLPWTLLVAADEADVLAR